MVVFDLTLDETAELSQHETVIEHGLKTFTDVGGALLAIREKRLYRAQYKTFEDYCRERWGMSRVHGHRLIEAAVVAENLLPIGNIPETESQARELASLPPDDQRLAWQVVTETAPNGKVTADHVKSVVNVLKEIQLTGALDPGTGEMLPLSAAMKAAITEETYERMKRQETYIADKMEQKMNGKQKPKTNRAGDEYVPQGFDACQTPLYAIDPLLPYLKPDWSIWEPAQGEGLLVRALREGGMKDVIGSDLLEGQNFFEHQPDRWDCSVTNPPYSIKYKWLERCYELGKPFALLIPVETLGAQTAQTLFREHGIEVIFLDRRVNFKMPNIGWKGSAAQFPVAWFCYGLDIGQQMTFARLTRDANE